jgi:hypothetical protein
MADYRLHVFTWKNVIDYNWLRLPQWLTKKNVVVYWHLNKKICYEIQLLKTPKNLLK